jgi:hypothetical protein
MIDGEDATDFASRLAGATNRVVRDYREGDVVHEEPFSDQLCGRLKETLEGFETDNIVWQADVAVADKGRARLRARTLTKNVEEPALGGDIIMVLDVETPEYVIKKGFFAQAKRLERGASIETREHKRLLEQCDKMLSVTPASMVFLYGRHGVHVVPAAAVAQHKGPNLYDIQTYSLEVLYTDFALCWFGDPRIVATDRASLEDLRARFDAEAAIRFIGRGFDEEIYYPDRPTFKKSF